MTDFDALAIAQSVALVIGTGVVAWCAWNVVELWKRVSRLETLAGIDGEE